MNFYNDYKISWIEVDQIETNPNQPRKNFTESQLVELSESIKKFGILQPLSVRKISDAVYELVAGERRLRAAKLCGMEKIPVIVITIDEQQSALLAVIENIQREDLNFQEEAKAYFHLMNTFNYTQEEIASQIGKKQSTIANKVRLLKLPEDILELLIQNQLSERHARALLKINDESLLRKISNQLVEKQWTVAQTEEYILYVLDKQTSKGEKKEKSVIKSYLKDVRVFTNTIKQAVDMMNVSGIEAKYHIVEKENAYSITIDIPMEVTKK